MPDIIQLLQRRGRSLLGWLIIAWGLTGLMLWVVPTEYKSESTSIASSTVASDPSRLFGNYTQHLYSPLGSPDQLDLLVGSGRLDTTYRPIVRHFDLVGHYQITGDTAKAFAKAVKLLQKNTEVFKSDYGELKVRVWDIDANMAADLANAITAQLDSMHRDLMSRQNQQTRDALERGLKRLQLPNDSIDPTKEEFIRQQSLYRDLIEQYTLLLEQRPPAIQILDHAVPAVTPDKPKWAITLIAVTAVALLSWLIFALWKERRTFYEVAPDA